MLHPDQEDAFGDVVTTVRVINVPHHTTESDFNCWFLFAPGFVQAKLVPTRGQDKSQLGWALFGTVQEAEFAINNLEGRELTKAQSPYCTTVLSAEMAKSNFHLPGNYASPENQKTSYIQPSIPPQTIKNQQLSRGAGDEWSYQPPPPPQPIKIQQGWGKGDKRPHAQTQPHMAAQGRCSTLFLGGVRGDAMEHDVVSFVTAQCDGFESIKFHPGSQAQHKSGTAWVKFVTAELAEIAMHTINNGATLPGNPGIPLRAEFSKNELDQRQPENNANGRPQYHSQSPPRRPSPLLHRGQPIIIAPPAHRPMTSWQPLPPPGQPFHAAQDPRECDTLFIGNIDLSVPEEELQVLLEVLEGFIRMKFIASGNTMKNTALALFSSSACAREAKYQIHGTLMSDGQYSLNVEFAKNSLDKRQRVA